MLIRTAVFKLVPIRLIGFNPWYKHLSVTLKVVNDEKKIWVERNKTSVSVDYLRYQ